MSTETAPESCPFCGAGILIGPDGKKRGWKNPWITFKCFTNWHPQHGVSRKLQSNICVAAERERLTRERDQLRAWKESALAVEREWDPNAIATALGGRPGESQRAVIAREVPRLIARVKRLEEAGDMLQAAVVGVEGMTHWQWLASAHEADLNWRKAKEAKP